MTVLRHKGYETFLIIHIIFAIVVVYALFRYAFSEKMSKINLNPTNLLQTH
jgi:hypothetical protein